MSNTMSIDIMLLHLFNSFLLHKTCQPGNWCNVCMQIISASKWVEGKNLIQKFLVFHLFFFFFFFLLLAQIKSLFITYKMIFATPKCRNVILKTEIWKTHRLLVNWLGSQGKRNIWDFFYVKAVVYLAPREEIAKKKKAITNKRKLLIILEVFQRS